MNYDKNMEVADRFTQIELWLQENAKPLLGIFNPPATLSQIQKAESELGAIFPASVKQAYLIHNGEKDISEGLFGTWKWLSLGEMVLRHDELKNIEQEFKFGDFKPGFMIPLLESGGGDLYYVESVENEGDESEVIEWWHEQPTRDVKYENFNNMLSTFVKDLHGDRYVYIPNDLHALVHKDDL
ncbi:MAG: SMI1/KNR4 family protein [Cyanosarcina radialis HA8281-LM2]|jgi:cell wall assembly regulator SMI1|nr:SMI1/KNR4 family protein [Cyanosarcina radialis HA8281-LM2]